MRRILAVVVLALVCAGCLAQEEVGVAESHSQDSLFVGDEPHYAVIDDSLLTSDADMLLMQGLAPSDSAAAVASAQKRDWATWAPNPQRALWLAMVIPGAGQIYNRKYWKLPLVYGGFMGCIYAMSWNNSMYRDYSQAYLDLTDDDPGTRSYEKFAHLGRVINSENAERYKDIFKKRRDRYRRWRDLSFFVMVGVYALSVIDAYVDAELSVFDISKDLSLKVEPTLMQSPTSGKNPLYASSLGLNCSINF